MKNIFSLFAMLFAIVCHAQMVGTNVFLKGNYVEIGMVRNGAFGANGIPAGYHQHEFAGSGPTGSFLAEVYDIGHDGWTTGTPMYMGDYTYVGSPFEGWELQVNGLRSQAFQNTTGSISGSLGLTGANTGYAVTADGVSGYWSGTTPAGLQVEMETSVRTNASCVVMKVKLRNTSSVTMPNVYYLRSCDPDVDQTWPGGGFSTTNTIVYQNDAEHRVLVRASGTIAGASMSLGTKDARAKVLSYSSWPLSIITDLASVYAPTAVAGSTSGGDMAIALIFNLGSIPAGDSVMFSYAYIFDGAAGLDSAFTSPCSGMPFAGTVNANTAVACATTTVTLNATAASYSGGLALQWQSSPDSSSWTDIAGATTVSYIFTGLAATAFYRCKVQCISSGLHSFSPGKKITYSVVCPCFHSAGTVMPNTTSACATTGIVLNNTGYTASSGVALQWQSSPDSTTWTDIAGATAVPYSFGGLSATTYYRLRATCTGTGTEVFSAGVKLIFTPACVCISAPPPTVATASTTYCSSCFLTLGLTGLPSLGGYAFQWERSLNGTSGWTSMAGATTVSYTYSPDEAYYYRCKITCSAGGISYSSSVFVGYAYRIIADSVSGTIDTACSYARVYARANGISPLLRLKTFYGEATHDSIPLTVSGTQSYVSVLHNYPLPGVYTIKQILYHNNVPQDSILRFFEQVSCKTIPIRIYNDANGNCYKESSEMFNSVAVMVRVDSNSIPIDTVAALSGLYYKATGPVGTTYTFSILPCSRNVICPATGVHTVTLTTSAAAIPANTFGLLCGTSSLSDLAIYSDAFRSAANRQDGAVFPRNNHCLPTAGRLKMKYSFKYNASSTFYSHPPSYTSLPYFEWAIPARNATSANLRMYYRANAFPYLTVGDTVVTQMIFVPDSSPDSDTGNNVIIRTDTVTGPYDPNVIEVAPAGCFDTATQFRFTIHFENKGNDTAHNVYVLDTLSPWVDVASLQVVMSSAEILNTYFYTGAGYNIVKFDFPNIKLLDSSWDGLNEGMFIYDIKRRPDMPDGASILSRVGIYFDYNDVVMTNTTENRKGCPISTRLTSADVYRKVSLFPNPTTGYLTIKTETNTFTSFAITNTIGQQVWQQEMRQEEERVNLAHLPAGVYYITLKGGGVSEVRKFVKW